MRKRNLGYYFSTGFRFLVEHPQVWFTAFVGAFILGAFILTVFNFAALAQDAQRQLFNDRAGWLLDSFVLFAPDTLQDQPLMRTRIQSLMEQNRTIEYIQILAPHGNDAYRIYISHDGSQEGSLSQDPLLVRQADHAWVDTRNAITTFTGAGDDRRIVTTRAILDPSGSPQAVAVVGMRLSEADMLLQQEILQSTVVLGLVLIIIMYLFVRHARIVDYASLYKKQLEVDELKDSFISMASHELKSPLSVIRGYIEFLKEGDTEPEQRNEYLRRIDISATELRQLVDDILDVSRIEMGRLRFSPDYLTPADVLVEVNDMFKDAAHDKHLKLVLDVDEDAQNAIVRVDRGRLKQVMINLVSNAVKYTFEGTVVIAQKRTSAGIELSVRDSGVGMTAEEQHNLFGKFYRVETTETKGVSGTGLGLWITKYLVDHMGGTITVESIKGEGSRFVILFPERKNVDTVDDPTNVTGNEAASRTR